jgi:hypothetical protein
MNEQAFELLLEKHREADRRAERIEEKLDELLSFKWKIVGGSAVLSMLASFLVSLVTRSH